MTPPLQAAGGLAPEVAILALLVAGHLVAEFVLQTRWMVQRKASEPRALLAHGLEVFGVQSAAVLWFAWSPGGLALVAAIAALHLGVDRLRIAAEERWPRRPTTWLLADQGLHLVVLLVAWRLWPDPPPRSADMTLATVRLATLVGAYAFNVNGGSALVTCLLRALGPAPPDTASGPAGAGRLIGILERMLILTLVALDQWGAVGLVLTAKSVARFKRLEEQPFAEAYLIGTMTSVLVAVASGLLVRLVLGLG